jgi:hypothetical protein
LTQTLREAIFSVGVTGLGLALIVALALIGFVWRIEVRTKKDVGFRDVYAKLVNRHEKGERFLNVSPHYSRNPRMVNARGVGNFIRSAHNEDWLKEDAGLVPSFARLQFHLSVSDFLPGESGVLLDIVGCLRLNRFAPRFTIGQHLVGHLTSDRYLRFGSGVAKVRSVRLFKGGLSARVNKDERSGLHIRCRRSSYVGEGNRQWELHAFRVIAWHHLLRNSAHRNVWAVSTFKLKSKNISGPFSLFNTVRSSIRDSFVLRDRVLHRDGGVLASTGLLRHQVKRNERSNLLLNGVSSCVRQLLFSEFDLFANKVTANDGGKKQKPIESGLQHVEHREPEQSPFMTAFAWLACGAIFCVGFFFWLLMWGSGRLGRSSVVWGLLILIVAVATALHAGRLLVNAL